MMTKEELKEIERDRNKTALLRPITYEIINSHLELYKEVERLEAETLRILEDRNYWMGKYQHKKSADCQDYDPLD